MTLPIFNRFDFATAYECRAIPEVPSSRPTFRFPPSRKTESTGDELLVEFLPTGAPGWLGSFVREFDGCPDALLACPSRYLVCIVAGGIAYVVDARHAGSWRQLDPVPVMTSLGSGQLGLLFLASFSIVAAFDKFMAARWLVDLKSDGIEFVGVGAAHVNVRAYAPGRGTWQERQLSVVDGSFL